MTLLRLLGLRHCRYSALSAFSLSVALSLTHTRGGGGVALSQELAELAGTQFLQHTLRQRQSMSEEYSKKLEPIFMKNATKFPTARFNLPRCASIQYCLPVEPCMTSPHRACHCAGGGCTIRRTVCLL